MPPITTESRAGEPRQPSSDADLAALFARLSCACADSAGHSDAPMARALFLRVDGKSQPIRDAADALGIAAGDAAYLLAGLRRDVVQELILLLNETQPFKEATTLRDADDD